MNTLLSRYFLYLPVTLLKGERVLSHFNRYCKQQFRSQEVLERDQLAALQKLVTHAYNHSDFYREKFEEKDITPADIKSMTDMQYLPEVQKTDLIEHQSAMQAQRKKPWHSLKTTGGSTGQAVTILKNPGALARERAATAMAYEWAGVGMGAPQARFWGVPLHLEAQLKYRLVDFFANRIRLSVFGVDERALASHAERVAKFKPRYLYGYASSIVSFAEYMRDNQLKLPRETYSAITTSEVLTDSMRETISKSLGIPVFNEYGCGEVGSIAHECEHGAMHIMEDNLIVEVDKQNSSVDGGELIVTDLYNYSMPLIRYRIGDFATLNAERCECGRSFKRIVNIHGRAYDCIQTEDGKLFHPEMMMYIFESIKSSVGGIEQFQVIQTALKELRILIVKGNGFTQESLNLIREEVRRQVHPGFEMSFEFVDAIQRERSGKIRLIKNTIASA